MNRKDINTAKAWLRVCSRLPDWNPEHPDRLAATNILSVLADYHLTLLPESREWLRKKAGSNFGEEQQLARCVELELCRLASRFFPVGNDTGDQE